MNPSSVGANRFDVLIGRKADKQHGVVTRSQLLAMGLSRQRIESRIRRGSLIPLHRGVYAVARHGIGQRGWLQAALLALPKGAFLSHSTAAGVHDLRGTNPYQVHVSVPSRSSHPRESITVHRIRGPLQAWEISTIGGMRVSTIPRLLVELSIPETVTELRRMIDLAVTKRTLNHDRLTQALEIHRHRPGIAKLRAAYGDYARPPTGRASGLERAFDRVLAKHPEIPEPERNVMLGEWEVDFYWPEQRLILELDGGGYHLTVRNLERDRLRDARYLARGIRTLRVTDSRFEYDARGALNDLKAALRLG